MNNEIFLETKRKANIILDIIDEIEINTEVINNFNKLMYDKLEKLANLENNIGIGRDDLLIKLLDTTRNTSCYITMNYIISQKIKEIEERNKQNRIIIKEIINTISPIKERGQQ